MTLKEALTSQKKFRRQEDTIWYDPADAAPQFSIEEIMADDWVIKEDPKYYWVGTKQIQLHTKLVNMLVALEGDKPLVKTADGKEWIRVKEVVED